MMQAEHATELRALRRALAEKEAELAELRRALTGSLTTPRAWGLTATEERLLLALRRGTLMSRDALMTAVYQLAEDEPSEGVLDVMISKLRRKLARRAAGIHIETAWGRGWQLAPESARRLARILDPSLPDYRKPRARRFFWPEPAVTRLVELWKGGRTSPQITKILAQEGLCRVSRCAVIAKLHRLGLLGEGRHG
ncbi:winged helix-turn-helix domain-containing protein [Methylobacterium nodulans]|uniref:Putative two component transcriptional regulator, winged helix family n=1 Tax=Methylobacterium nodulans (strain LMG 21967 / CNCM I-2342 / ORS 2060) TaxID=460265 RepID=B8IAP6_METNO|nr:winged helix-turn-helix domain-containing protein [Methylobacterium nodulans]ACL61091.1 putative two component transcriptional regulator, winged helix family [Methylobacterium nodulans ORS 2060]